jgi:hypothetical protein
VLVAPVVLIAEASARVLMVRCCYDHCCASDARPPARRLACVISNVVGAMVLLVAPIVPLVDVSARVPVVYFCYEAETLAALTALLVEGSLALLATRLLLRQ